MREKFQSFLMLAAVAALAGCASKNAAEAEPTRVAITVTEKGFEPAVVTVPHDKPVILMVTRKTDQTCARELVMPDQKINRPLPLDQTVEISFTPKKTGELHYACGMNMFTGTVRVE